MAAGFDDPAAFDHEDLVGAADGGQAMGDHDRRLALHQPVQRVEDELLAFRVQARGGLVQDQDRQVADQGARDGDALLLSARQRDAALADDGVVAIGHLVDELAGVGQLRGAHDLVHRSRRDLP